MHFDSEKNQYIIDPLKQEKPKKRMRPRRPRFLLPLLMSLSVLALIAVLAILSGAATPLANRVASLVSPSLAVVGSDIQETAKDTSSLTSNNAALPGTDSSAVSSGDTGSVPANTVKINGAMLTPGVEFSPDLTAASTIETTLAEMNKNGLSTVFLNLNYNGSLLCNAKGFQNPAPIDILQSTIASAHQKGMSVMAVVDLSKLAAGDLTADTAKAKLQTALSSVAQTNGLDGLLLGGISLPKDNADFSQYLSLGGMGGYDDYLRDKLSASVRDLSSAVHTAKNSLYLGLICDPVWAKNGTVNGGISVTATIFESYSDGHADTALWMQKGYFNLALVNSNTSTEDTTIPFDTIAKWWSAKVPATADVGFLLSSDKVNSSAAGWKNPDQLTRQLMSIASINRQIFAFNSYKALQDDKTGSTSAVYKYIKGEMDDGYVLKNLSFSSPTKRNLTTYSSSISVIGASDPEFPLTLNGANVKRTEFGYFSLQLDLKVGINTFTFSHKGTDEIFKITYRYIVLKDISPSTSGSFDGGSTIVVKATARAGSTVTAKLNGSTITLSPAASGGDSEEPDISQSEFLIYSGVFILPSGYSKNTSIGKITFTGNYNGITETMSSGTVTIKKGSQNSGTITPSPLGGSYLNVGKTLVAEVDKYQIETFDSNRVDDYSRPTNNYLPLGTVDYCSVNTIYDASSRNTYRTLQYGKRVYTTSKGVTNIKTYRGSLPDHNNIAVKSFKQSGKYSILTLKTDWKAPFLFDLSPQKYINPQDQDIKNKPRYELKSITYNYIDITFCYAASLTGPVDLGNNPLFSRAEVIKNKSDYTLRLYLKKTGAFYGWNAKYNSGGDLEFSFLNPVKVNSASNKYGVSLSGVKIVIDPGHGGSDQGNTTSPLATKKTEAQLTLLLSQKVESRLKALGATVVMTRTTDLSMTSDERTLKVKNAGADLAVSIHRNASSSVNPSAFNSYHFNAFTKAPAQYIYSATDSANLYKKTAWSGVKWHYFYLSRITDCPVVLTENGYMTNADEYQKMLSDTFNDNCADAIVQGVVNYFKSIQ